MRDAAWAGHDRFGTSCLLEHPRAERPHLGVRVRVVQPGEPVGLYHEEDAPEAFLVLAGECLLVVEEEERTLRAWDFFHSPAGTAYRNIAKRLLGEDVPFMALETQTGFMGWLKNLFRVEGG